MIDIGQVDTVVISCDDPIVISHYQRNIIINDRTPNNLKTINHNNNIIVLITNKHSWYKLLTVDNN